MTSEIISPILCSQPDDVVQVKPLDGFRLYVYFWDGTQGVVEMANLIHGPHAGVFAGLADPARFAEAYVQYGAVVWPGDIDLAPDAMYSEIQKTGKWTLA